MCGTPTCGRALPPETASSPCAQSSQRPALPSRSSPSRPGVPHNGGSRLRSRGGAQSTPQWGRPTWVCGGYQRPEQQAVGEVEVPVSHLARRHHRPHEAVHDQPGEGDTGPSGGGPTAAPTLLGLPKPRPRRPPPPALSALVTGHTGAACLHRANGTSHGASRERRPVRHRAPQAPVRGLLSGFRCCVCVSVTATTG